MEEETVGELLKRLLSQKGMSQRKLANLSGVDRGYINSLVKGRRGSITLRIARKLASALDESPEIFLRSTTYQPKESHEDLLERYRITMPASVPIYEELALHAGEPVEPLDYVPVPREQARGKRLEAYIARGHCLEPEVKDGNIIIIDRDGEIDTGDIVACLVQGELRLARLRKIADELYLENNERRIKLEEAQVAAPVIEVRRKLK